MNSMMYDTLCTVHMYILYIIYVHIHTLLYILYKYILYVCTQNSTHTHESAPTYSNSTYIHTVIMYSMYLCTLYSIVYIHNVSMYFYNSASTGMYILYTSSGSGSSTPFNTRLKILFQKKGLKLF
jgi:hypothetical protein